MSRHNGLDIISLKKLVVPKQHQIKITLGDRELPPTVSRLVSDHQTIISKFVTVKIPLYILYMKLENGCMGWIIIEESCGIKVI